MNKKSAVILVHGVGHADEGSTIQALLEGDENTDDVSEFGTLQVGRFRYTTARTNAGVELFESNWADARPLQSGGLRILLEALLLVLGMLQVSQFQSAEPRCRKQFLLGRAYKFIFLGCFFWSIHPPIVSMFVLADLPLLAASWIVMLAVAVWWFQKYDKDFRWGFVWVALTAGLWAAFAVATNSELEELFVHASTWPYVGAQLLTILSGWLALGAIRFRQSFRSTRIRNVRYAFIYVPFFVASCVGAVVWVIALCLVRALSLSTDSNNLLGTWPDHYSTGLGYSVYSAEQFNGILTLLCGLLFLFPLLTFFKARKHDPSNTAVRARESFDVVLKILPVLLLLSVPAFYFLVLRSGLDQEVNADSVWRAYTTWSVRVLGFLPFLFGGIAIVLKASGDVLYYLSPQTELISVRSEAVEKLRSLANYLVGENYEVLVLSHSQGTIISLDVAKLLPKQLSIWISGSPSDALYFDYLEIDRVAKLEVKDFKNFYREDDPIAGRIRPEVCDDVNVPWGKGGHTNYWKEFSIERLHAVIQQQVS